ncbi:MAG: hypothetical protein HY363_02125 [Candidatus Aenigmarchaeota archaeon]|nr:hypothetical protein [Candidatus Aenigmarchaeota archaeon]
MSRKTNLTTINTCLLVILLIILVVNTYSVIKFKEYLKPKQAQKLPQVELTLIKVANCEQCFDVAQIEQYVKQLGNINLTKTTTLAEAEANELITQYSLANLPAAVIIGEIENLTIENFAAKNNALIFDQPPAPYYDTAVREIKGKVTATIITDKTCKQCADLNAIIAQLKQMGVLISSTKTLDKNTSEAKKLIEKYNIEKIPTMLFSKDALLYDVFQRVWSTIGTTEKDETLVMRQVNPPYKDLATNSVKGLVALTYVADKSCTDCFNVSILKEVMTSNFGVQFVKENFADTSSSAGKRLIEKYNITNVPTILLSAEVKDYPSIEEVWQQAGTIEKDGTYVFRNMNLLEGQTYKNLQNNQVITAGASEE